MQHIPGSRKIDVIPKYARTDISGMHNGGLFQKTIPGVLTQVACTKALQLTMTVSSIWCLSCILKRNTGSVARFELGYIIPQSH